MTIIYADDRTSATLTGRRLRVRRVDEHALAARAVERCIEIGKPAIRCEHGGDVNNSYGYRAETEGVLAVALDPATVVIWAKRLNANKVTLSGAAGCYGYLFDGRTNDETKRAVRERLVADAICVIDLRDRVAAIRHAPDAEELIDYYAGVPE